MTSVRYPTDKVSSLTAQPGSTHKVDTCRRQPAAVPLTSALRNDLRHADGERERLQANRSCHATYDDTSGLSKYRKIKDDADPCGL